MRACVLVTRAIRFNDVPAEQREDLVETGVAVQVSVIEVGEAAVTEANVSGNQRQSIFTQIADTVAVLIEVRAGVDVGLPLVSGNVAHTDGLTAGQTYWS